MAYQAIDFLFDFSRPLDTKTKYGKALIEHFILLTVGRPGQYPNPDTQGIDEAARHLREWTYKIGFPVAAIRGEHLTTSAASFSVFMLPNHKVGDKQIRVLGYMTLWFFAVNDVFDKSKVEMNKDESSIKFFGAAFGAMANILSGNYEDIRKFRGAKILHYEVLCQALIEIKQMMSQDDCDWEEHSTYLVRYVREYLVGNYWRCGKVSEDNFSELTYLHFRGHFSTLFVVFEMLALLNHIFLPRAVREDIDFVRYINACVMAGAIGNDALGFENEIMANETKNLILHKVLNHRIDLDHAFVQSVTFVNEETREARVISDRFIKTYPEDEVLKGYIRVTNWGMEGHLRWHGHTKMYGQISIMEILKYTENEVDQLIKVGQMLSSKPGGGTLSPFFCTYDSKSTPVQHGQQNRASGLEDGPGNPSTPQ